MNVRVSRIANGLTVVTDNMPRLKTAALGVWVKTGSRSETERENGITHLLEHMAFKGTKTRSARQIAEEIEAVGGELNAATSAEQTNYYARVLAEDVPLAVDLLADILQNSTFDADELTREKHVILQEIGAASDAPDDKVFDQFQEAAWAGQAIGRPILGTKKSVMGFTPDDLRSYLAKRYRAPEMVLSAAGAVDHDVIVAMAEEKFAGLSSKPADEEEPAYYTGGDARVTRDLMELQLLIGFEGRSYRAQDYYATQILASVMGGGMSSRLFQEVRETRGLCYAIFALHWAFRDTGVFAVNAATGAEDVEQLVPVIIGELMRASADISDAEVERSKAQIRAGLMMSLESPAARAGQIARQILVHGRVMSLEEITAKIEAVSSGDLRKIAGEIFTGKAPTVSVVGPAGKFPDYSEIQEKFALLGGEIISA